MKIEEKLKPVTILMADDDLDDQYLAREAFKENRMINDLRFVNDGEELMSYLLRKDPYNADNAPKPGLILLDINMPKKSGLDALREIKANPQLRSIPIVILTTSKSDEDVLASYDIGVSSFITKPVSFEGLVEVMKKLGQYWLGVVVLPDED